MKTFICWVFHRKWWKQSHRRVSARGYFVTAEMDCHKCMRQWIKTDIVRYKI